MKFSRPFTWIYRNYSLKVTRFQFSSDLLENANKGDGKSQFELGLNYFYGKNNTESNFDKAFDYFNKSVLNKYPDGKVYLGQCYNFGYGVKKDLQKAFYWYKEALKDGDIHSFIKLGFLYRDKEFEENPKKAFEYFLKAAEKDVEEGLYLTGLCYLNGDGIEKDIQKALDFLKKATDLGYDVSRTYLAECYLKGALVPKDLKKGYELYYLSAESGSISSLIQVGYMLHYGIGVEKNEEKAKEYFEMIALNEDIETQFMLGNLFIKFENDSDYYKRGCEIIKKLAEQKFDPAVKVLSMIYYQDEKFSVRVKCIPLLQELADKGDKQSAYLLALSYMKGDLINADEKLAFAIFSELAEDGDVPSKLHVGTSYLNGQGTKVNVKKGLKLIDEAHREGNKDAGHILGVLYSNGEFVKKNIKTAFQYFLESAHLGNTESMCLVGSFYLGGNEIEQSLELAIEYLQRAVNLGHKKSKEVLSDVEKTIIELEAEPIKIEFETTNKLGKCPGYIAGNSKKGLIVIQEWWGVEEGILRKGSEYSMYGFKILVPDLYRGKIAKNEEEAGHLMNGLDWEGAYQDIQGAVDYLKLEGCEKIGIVGFCMGGALSLGSTVNVSGLSCASFFYGIPNMNLSPKIPIQGHFGNLDNVKGFSDSETVNQLEKKLKESNADFQIFRYENASHGFTNDLYHSINYDKESTELATKRLFEFMNKHLNP